MERITKNERIENEQVEKKSKDVKTITVDQAGQMLLSYIERRDFADRYYEFAQELCENAIREIESKYSIVSIFGEPYTSDDDEMWYDEYRNDFMKAAFERLESGF